MYTFCALSWLADDLHVWNYGVTCGLFDSQAVELLEYQYEVRNEINRTAFWFCFNLKF